MDLKTINGLLKIGFSLPQFSTYGKEIDKAKVNGHFEKERENICCAEKIFAKQMVKELDATVTVLNPENLPESGPCVYVSNHQSYGDILAMLYAIPHQIGFISKDSISNIPFFGKWVLRTRSIFIRRKDARSSLVTINRGVSYLKDGFSLVIFPEGTRSWGPEMGKFKAGSFKLATRAGVPIVPITINGACGIYEDNKALTKGAKITMIVHPQIPTEGLKREELIVLPEKVQTVIQNGLDQILKND